MNWNRREFLSSLSVLGVAGLCPIPSLAETAPEVADGTILKSGPYLQYPSANSITVRWLTHVPSFSWVEYGEKPDQLQQKSEVVHHGLVEANNTVHALTIAGLEPGKQYHYRICSKEIRSFKPYELTYGDTYMSEVFPFQTSSPGAKEVSFLVFNDIHDRPESFPKLMQYQGPGKKDFVFLNGDMFNYQEDEAQLVNHLLKPISEWTATTPFFFSRGNHETRGKFARQLPDYFNGDRSPFYFSIQYGPMYAIVLDSGEDKPDDTPVYAGLVDFDRYRIQQAEWLKNEIRKKEFKKAKYKLVFSHIPLYYSGDWHGTMHCREVWGDILNEAKIDVLISGHTHKYGIHPAVKGQHDYPIVIGGGPQDGKRTIMRVKADDKAFRLEMIDDAGKMVGELAV